MTDLRIFDPSRVRSIVEGLEAEIISLKSELKKAKWLNDNMSFVGATVFFDGLEKAYAELKLRAEAAEKKAAELEARDVVPRSRYDVCCEQYTEAEKARKILSDRCRELESR